MGETTSIALFEILLPIVILVVIIALGVIVMVQQFQRSLYRQRLHQENLKTQHQREMLRSAIAVQEKERQRIAGDLHDELGARLSIALMQLKQINDPELRPETDLEAFLLDLQEHLELALDSTKRISYELMPPQLINLGLYKALLVKIQEVRKTRKVIVELRQSGELSALSWPVQLGVYRMVTELLNNTLKHAHATEVIIELKKEPTSFLCHYRDNGKGLPDTLSKKGLGLQNIESRTQALGGTVTWENAQPTGFFAFINIPIKSSE